jgi:hypothetical protein
MLPNAEHAEIDPEKLRGYPFSAGHPVGRFKARFFSALGFSADRWQEFADALRIQHLTQDAQLAKTTERGTKYTIRAMLSGPTGQSAVVVRVWFLPTDAEIPRFVTGLSRRLEVTVHPLDVVVLNRDLPAHGLRRGDLGAVVDVDGPDAIEVEFVTASGRTQALVTLRRDDIRHVGDDDLVAVRSAGSPAAGRDG